MLAIGLDLGGSHASCALLRDDVLLAKGRVSLPSSSFADSLPVLQSLIESVTAKADVRPANCDGIAFGFPGIVDVRRSTIIATNGKFDDAVTFDLTAWARTTLRLPLVLENDARLALLGEHFCGGAKGTADAVLVTLGTGIGAAAMLAGLPLRGRHGNAGCLGGHLPVVFQGRLCSCGNVGCAEAEASTWALPGICRDWPGFASSRLNAMPQLGFADLFAAADMGDVVALQVLERCFAVWSALAVALCHAYSPEVLLFGGAVMARAETILSPIRAHIGRHAWGPSREIAVRAASLGEEAALYGAVPLLREVIA